MKKYIILLFIASVFYGCEKQPSTGDDVPEQLSLPGKTYAAAFSRSGGKDLYWVARFVDSKTVEWSARSGSPVGTFIGTPDIYPYTFTYPSLVITRPSDGAKFRGQFTSFDIIRITITDIYGDDNLYEFVIQK